MPSGHWVTLRDGRRVFIEGAQPSINTPSWYTPSFIDRSSDDKPPKSTLGLTTCIWCAKKVYFVRAENGGCFLADDIPPPQWDIHDCWVSHQTQKGINKKLNEHYKRCGIKPLFEKNILIKRESFKKKFVGKTNRECSSDLVVKGEVNRVGWFIIHSIYKKYAILNGDKFFVIRLWYKNKSISCLIRGSIIERRILKKREKYFVMLSSFVYDDKNYVYISKLIKPCLIDVSITECKELFFNDW